MALNNLTFNLGKSGTGRPLPGEDYISGLLFYNAALPSGFSTGNRIKQLFSPADAITLGILNDYSDATAAAATYLITTLGGTTDSIKITSNETFGIVTTLCNYAKVAGDTTILLLGASVAAAINAGTVIHGYMASFATATLTITAPKKFGIFLNTGTPLIVTVTGTIAGTLTQFSGGVASVFAVWYYHISEYFRMQPSGNLFVGIYAVPGSYTFTEITTMQNFANGKIRQIGVYKDSAAFASADVIAIHNVCATLVGLHKEIVALYGADISGTSDVSTLADLSLVGSNYCTAVISQDGAAKGAFLFAGYGKSITTLGAALGTVALATVAQSIAWVAKFNISNGTECDTIAFANGVLFSNAVVTDGYLTVMQNMRYVFLRKFVGVSGSYFNENSTSILASSPYAYIADNRTIQKATRGIYTNLIAALNGPITLNADGTLSNEAIAYYTGLSQAPLIQMIRNGEISAQSVTINTTQNILATGILTINVNLVQIATGRNLNVNIGYVVSV
jgi:hypothetical protein